MIVRFQTELIAEHMTAQAQQQAAGGSKQNPPAPAQVPESVRNEP